MLRVVLPRNEDEDGPESEEELSRLAATILAEVSSTCLGQRQQPETPISPIQEPWREP